MTSTFILRPRKTGADNHQPKHSRLRTPVKQAISEGYLDRDPFILHKSKTVRKTVYFPHLAKAQNLERIGIATKDTIPRLILHIHIYFWD
jgi:hypothetical protein